MRINGKVSYFELEQLVFIFKNSLVNSYLKKIYHYNKLFMFKFNHISFVYDRNYLWTGTFSEREDGRKLHSLCTKLRKEIGAKKGKMMIMIAVGKPKKANKGAIMKVASKLEKASKAHAGQAKTLRSLKLARGGGAAIRGMNFKGVY